MSDKPTGTNPFNHLLEADRQQQNDEVEQKTEKEPTAQQPKKLRTGLRKKVRKHVNHFDQRKLNREEIELLWFELRNTDKKRVTADIPEEWRDELYRMALDLKIGRYEFVGYILASFLGKTRRED